LERAFLILCAANAIGIIAMLWKTGLPFRISFGRLMRRRYARILRQLGWAGLSVTLSNLQGQGVAFLVTAFGGPAAYAPIAATLLLFSPMRIAGTAVVNLLQPEIAGDLARGEIHKVWGELKLWPALGAAGCLLYGAAMTVVIPRIHLHMLDGVPILVTGIFAWTIYALALLYLIPRIVLEVMSAFDTVSVIIAIAAAVGAVLIIGLLIVAPPIWALAGGAVSEFVVFVGYWSVTRRKLKSAMIAGEAADLGWARP
jgi:hypothetical protein